MQYGGGLQKSGLNRLILIIPVFYNKNQGRIFSAKMCFDV